ncbi:DNA ligase (ATP) [Purpureocillium lavendulum]|uniref:DNA ligase (ATP) n=1 Tax=Purpureocillium lavendulum TaxID=1247861 RepID=A0AB34FAB8_9HYPO|nr:DNA ligase (ATP) [Purpureocillium lavendulum]
MDTNTALTSLLTEYEIGVKQRQDARMHEDKGLEKAQHRTLKGIDDDATDDLSRLEAERDRLLNQVTDFEKDLLALYQDLADREKECSESREATKARKGKETEFYGAKKKQLLQDRDAEDAVHRSALLHEICGGSPFVQQQQQPPTVGSNNCGLIVIGTDRIDTVTERHMVDLDAKADEDHFKSFTDELEKMVRVNLALNPQPGILDNAERELLRGYLANPDNLNETLFRDACRGESLGGGDLAAFKHLITFTHQMSASLKHIALYIQTCLQGDANPSIPSSGDLRKMLLFMQLILPPINRLRIRTAPVEGWNPTSGFIYGQ